MTTELAFVLRWHFAVLQAVMYHRYWGNFSLNYNLSSSTAMEGLRYLTGRRLFYRHIGAFRGWPRPWR